MISVVASKYNNSHDYLDIDDFIQDGLLALFYACKSYDSSKNASVKTYFMTCIDNRFKNIIKSQNSKKTIPADSLISINESVTITSDDTLLSAEEILESKDYIAHFTSTLKNTLSEKEYTIVKLHLSGMSYKEIAKNLSITEKAVDNALSRARQKLSKK